MHLFGRGNWWLPRSMARRLPQLHVEGPSDTFLRPTDDPEPVMSR
jgi:RND superfamily putative drug exporter